MLNHNRARVLLFALTGLLNSSPILANMLDQPVLHPAIPLLDEEGQHVLNSGKPYSSRMSCGEAGCHNYESITHSFHIEQGRDEASDDFGALRGLPQIVSPGYFGGYSCMGRNNPDQLAKKTNASAEDFGDMGSPGWVMRCVGCHSGGGWMEKDRNGRRYDEVDPASVPAFDGDYYNRGTDENNQPTDASVVSQWDWQKSGVVENDCLMCHADFSRMAIFDPQLNVEGAPEPRSLQKTLRATKLIRGGHFRYANTATLEFLNLDITGEAEPTNLVMFIKKNVKMTDNGRGRMDLSFDLAIGVDGRPIMGWNPAAFDSSMKVQIPMVRFPTNETCYSCHRTSASRRGFYGFGEDAAPSYEDDGVLVEDYKDDVHYGIDWTEANGETRSMTSCNACHARNYYREPYINTDLDTNHDPLKGNSDMNVRDDLDNQPNAKNCVYCHNDAENPAIPSGRKNMLAAHVALWRRAGDMAGYPKDTLWRITKTHFNQLSCQSCHITGKEYRGKPMQIMYRNRQEEDGKLRIVPYNPRTRSFWQDKNSGRVLTKTERNSVFRLAIDADGKNYGEMVDPETGAVVATVGARFSHGSWRFSDPDTYDGYVALKRVYDKVLALKGVSTPDTAMILTEINQYLMSHNTRPAVSSVQCEDCHARKQNGSFSPLIKRNGILGPGNLKTVATLPDRRLVDDGIVILDLPYLQINDAGEVTENVEDILYYTLMNPSMSRLNASIATAVRGAPKRMSKSEAVAGFGPANGKPLPVRKAAALSDAIYTHNAFLYKSFYGAELLREVKIIANDNYLTDMLLPQTSFEVSLPSGKMASAAEFAAAKGLTVTSDIFKIEMVNAENERMSRLYGTEFLVRLPYHGDGFKKFRLLISPDGENWRAIGWRAIVTQRKPNEWGPGFVIVRTTELGYMTTANLNGLYSPLCGEDGFCDF